MFSPEGRMQNNAAIKNLRGILMHGRAYSEHQVLTK